MVCKKNSKKVDFLKVSKQEQQQLIKKALKGGQKLQRKLEEKYEIILKEEKVF